MLSPGRTQDVKILSERLLITRIITSVGLALLLMVGAWTATHAEQEAEAPVSTAVTELIDAHVAPAASEVAARGSGWSGAVLGAAVCVFGLLCGLLLVIATRWLHLRRPLLPDRGSLPLIRSLLPMPASPRMTARSLTQLRISRT